MLHPPLLKVHLAYAISTWPAVCAACVHHALARPDSQFLCFEIQSHSDGSPVLASYPGSGGGGEKRAWYRPFAHAFNYPNFLGNLHSSQEGLTFLRGWSGQPNSVSVVLWWLKLE